MIKIKYLLKTAWAWFWCEIVWGGLQAINIYPSFDNKVFSWIVSQTGFLYVSYQNYRDYEIERKAQ